MITVCGIAYIRMLRLLSQMVESGHRTVEEVIVMADTLIKDRGSGLQRQFWRTGSARSLDNPWQPGRKQIAEQVHLWRSSVAAIPGWQFAAVLPIASKPNTATALRLCSGVTSR